MNKAVDILPFYEAYRELALCYVIENDLNNALKCAKAALTYNSKCEKMLEIITKISPKYKNFVREKETVINGEYESSKDCKQLKYSKIYDSGIITRNPPKYLKEMLSENQKNY